jgi:hypothetical protein
VPSGRAPGLFRLAATELILSRPIIPIARVESCLLLDRPFHGNVRRPVGYELRHHLVDLRLSSRSKNVVDLCVHHVVPGIVQVRGAENQ